MDEISHASPMAVTRRCCRLLGWEARAVGDADADAALEAVRPLGRGDAVIVLSHDIDLSSRVLASALASGVGYVGALGSRGTQGRRREWLTANGVDDETVDRIRGPAGLDLAGLSVSSSEPPTSPTCPRGCWSPTATCPQPSRTA